MKRPPETAIGAVDKHLKSSKLFQDRKSRYNRSRGFFSEADRIFFPTKLILDFAPQLQYQKSVDFDNPVIRSCSNTIETASRATLAHQVEQRIRNAQVTGSTPVGGSILEIFESINKKS